MKRSRQTTPLRRTRRRAEARFFKDIHGTERLAPTGTLPPLPLPSAHATARYVVAVCADRGTVPAA